jgi:hypothetical protein
MTDPVGGSTTDGDLGAVLRAIDATVDKTVHNLTVQRIQQFRKQCAQFVL